MPIVSNVSYGNGLHPLNRIPAGARTRQPLSGSLPLCTRSSSAFSSLAGRPAGWRRPPPRRSPQRPSPRRQSLKSRRPRPSPSTLRRLRVKRAHAARARPGRGRGHRARDGRHGRPALQGRRERRPRARRARRRRHHLRPGDQRSPLGGELAEPAFDRQHHQGDDGDGVPRERPGSDAKSSPSCAATSIARRRPICAPTTRSRRATCCTCCSSRPTTRRPARSRASRRSAPTGFIARMNAKAAELGLETTHYADTSGLLSDNVSSALRHGAAHRARIRRRADRVDHADERVHRADGPPAA